MAAPLAVLWTVGIMLVLLAPRLAGPPVPLLAALLWIVAAVTPRGALGLVPRFDDAGFEIDEGPPEPEGLAWRIPSERATDQRALFLRDFAASRIFCASLRVSGSRSGSAATGASISVATFLVTLPRRIAIFNARDRMRWTLRTVLDDRPCSSIVAYALSRCSGASRSRR
jgi:hypothetical protein